MGIVEQAYCPTSISWGSLAASPAVAAPIVSENIIAAVAVVPRSLFMSFLLISPENPQPPEAAHPSSLASLAQATCQPRDVPPGLHSDPWKPSTESRSAGMCDRIGHGPAGSTGPRRLSERIGALSNRVG